MSSTAFSSMCRCHESSYFMFHNRKGCIACCIENRSKCVKTARNRPIQRTIMVPRICIAIQPYSARVYSRAIQDTAYTLYSPIRRSSGKAKGARVGDSFKTSSSRFCDKKCELAARLVRSAFVCEAGGIPQSTKSSR